MNWGRPRCRDEVGRLHRKACRRICPAPPSSSAAKVGGVRRILRFGLIAGIILIALAIIREL